MTINSKFSVIARLEYQILQHRSVLS